MITRTTNMLECAACVVRKVCILINIEGDFLMKKSIFLVLLLSSFMAVACDDAIQGAGGPVTDGKQSPQINSGLSSFSDNSDIGQIECDDIDDQGTILVSGVNLAPFYWIPGGGFGGPYFGGGGGGGTAVAPQTMPNNPNNGEPDATCSDPAGIRQNHARADIALRLPTLSIGQVVEVEYSNGQSELFTIACKYCSITGVPVAGTCG